MLDEALHRKLRILQAEKIKKAPSSISFSKILNEVVKKGLK